MRRRLALGWLAACGGAPEPAPGASATPTLAGRWQSGLEGLPPAIVRADAGRLDTAPVVAHALQLDPLPDAPASWRFCLRDLRQGEPEARLATPCDCAGAAPTDCLTGTLRLADTLVADTPLAFTLDPADARADFTGVLAWSLTSRGEVLALSALPITDVLALRPDVADGLQGPLWSGADTLGWFERP